MLTNVVERTDLFAKSKVQLIMHYPFFGILVAHLPTVPKDPGWFKARRLPPTAAVDGKRIFYNAEWVKILTELQRLGLLCHEVLHPALMHLWRRGSRLVSIWRKATDYVVNDIILSVLNSKGLPAFELPPRGLYDRRFHGMSAEQVYTVLLDEKQKKDEQKKKEQEKQDKEQEGGGQGKGQSGKGEQDGADDDNQEDGMDGHIEKPEKDDDDKKQDDEKNGKPGKQDKKSKPEDSDEDGAGDAPGDDDDGADEDEKGGDDGADEEDGDEEDGNEDGKGGEDGKDGEGGKDKKSGKGKSGKGDDLDGDGEGEGSDDSDEGENGDAESQEESEEKIESEVERNNLDHDWKELVGQASMAAQGRGDLPGDLKRLVEQITKPKVNWQSVVDRFVSEASKDDYNMLKQDHRSYDQGIFIPEMDSPSTTIAVAVDTSGSISQEILHKFAAEAQGILRCRGVKNMRLLSCDDEVHLDVTLGPNDDIPSDFPGGGGTNFCPVFDRINDLNYPADGGRPALVIYITDMDGTFPREDPGIPTLWVAYRPEWMGEGRNVPPFGTVVEYPKEENS
jgi:predicted metal-dependent peptidase